MWHGGPTSLEEIEQSPHDEQTILWTLVDRYVPIEDLEEHLDALLNLLPRG